jgi:predicted Zn-dependent protease
VRAIEIDPTNPEVHQTAASVRLSQCRPVDAKECIEQSLSLWSSESPESIQWPAYPQRVACAKILLELGLYESAMFVLQTCQQENDQDPEGWYLFAWCYFRMGGGEAGAADQEIAAQVGGLNTLELSIEQKVAHWIDAKECLEKLQQVRIVVIFSHMY